MKLLFLIGLLIFNYFLFAQPPIGQWQEHLPYNNAINICEANNKIYAATNFALLYVDLEDNSLHKLSRTNGLAETGITVMKKNENSSNIIIAYNNSNLDIISGNKIKTINDIKRKNIVADKTIYNLYGKNNITYVCTGFGIVAIDETRKETKDTYFIGNGGSYVKVNSLTDDGVFFYAATAEGLKKAPINSTALNDFITWQTIVINGFTNSSISDVKYFGNKIILQKNDSLFQLNGSTTNLYYTTTNKIKSTNVSNGKLLICENGFSNLSKIVQLETNGTISNTFQNAILKAPGECIKTATNYWVADSEKGLLKIENNTFTNYTGNAPLGIATGELFFQNTILYAAAGAINNAWTNTFNKNGIFKLDGNNWTTISKNTIPAMDSMPDIVTLIANISTLYAGSFGGGLLKINENNTIQIFKQNSTLQPAAGSLNNYYITGLALDETQNIWVSNYGAAKNLHVLKTNNAWQSFTIPFAINNNVAQIIIDGLNQKWIVAPNGNGLICYNSGNNIDATNDDKWKQYLMGNGNGNLPSNQVNCVALDKEETIWVGTEKGIALIACTGEVFAGNGCQAILPIVQQDQFAGYLFQNENVQCIAVDGANRKWVGTKNGAWLISASGEKIIYRFSEDNSFLVNNDVKKIAINPKTGEVFFATANGICSFRSTATEASTNETNALIFPNPVPANYNGIIGIRNLPNNSIVKITELNGRLVYQTKATGGQATWNGLNYKGQKINSGAYLVLSTNQENNEKLVGKIFFIGSK
jgi:hypothetical protein